MTLLDQQTPDANGLYRVELQVNDHWVALGRLKKESIVEVGELLIQHGDEDVEAVSGTDRELLSIVASKLVSQYTDITGLDVETTAFDTGYRAELTLSDYFATIQEAHEWESSFKKFILQSRGDNSDEVTR